MAESQLDNPAIRLLVNLEKRSDVKNIRRFDCSEINEITQQSDCQQIRKSGYFRFNQMI